MLHWTLPESNIRWVAPLSFGLDQKILCHHIRWVMESQKIKKKKTMKWEIWTSYGKLYSNFTSYSFRIVKLMVLQPAKYIFIDNQLTLKNSKHLVWNASGCCFCSRMHILCLIIYQCVLNLTFETTFFNKNMQPTNTLIFYNLIKV